MDRQLLERMIGAGVLMLALVVIAPAILDGQRDAGVTAYRSESVPGNATLRTHTIRLDRQSDKPPVARQVSARVEPEVGKTPPRSKAGADAKPAAAKPAAKPAPVKVAAAPAPKPAATKTSAAAPAGWSVQLGSFARQQNAKRLANEVGGHGFKTYVLPLERPERTLYRVRVGPEDSRAAAEKLAGRLVKAGYKGQLTPP